MVLQVGTYSGQVVHRRDAAFAQQVGVANAREFEDLHRADAARAQNDLARGAHLDHLGARPHLHANAALAAVGLLLDQQLADLSLGPQLEVRPSVTGRAQKGLGGIPAPALFLVDLEIAHALVIAPVEVIGGRDASLLSGLGKGVEHVPAQALPVYPPFTARASGT